MKNTFFWGKAGPELLRNAEDLIAALGRDEETGNYYVDDQLQFTDVLRDIKALIKKARD